MIETISRKGINIAVVSEQKLGSAADVLDLMASVYFDGCDRMIVSAELLPGGFFDLRTGIAGEILQKFSTYGMRLAIIGDFKNVKSNALRDFIYESNKGNRVFFVATQDEAVERLV